MGRLRAIPLIGSGAMDEISPQYSKLDLQRPTRVSVAMRHHASFFSEIVQRVSNRAAERERSSPN